MRLVLTPEMDIRTARRFLSPPAVTAAITLLFVFGLVYAALGTYWSSYFPYEDDYSLLHFSAREAGASPVAWVTRGFTEYFQNDPACPLPAWGYVRPLVNLTHYLESFLGPRPEGFRLMLTNIVCWLASVGLVFALARRLGAAPWESSVAAVLFGLSPCWYRNLLHSSFRNNGLAAVWMLGALLVLLHPRARVRPLCLLVAGVAGALAAASHEQGLSNLPVIAALILYSELRCAVQFRKKIRNIAAGVALTCLPTILLVTLFRFLNADYGNCYGAANLVGAAESGGTLAWLATLVMRGFLSAAGVPLAFTPSGADNLLSVSPLFRFIVCFPSCAAAAALVERSPSVLLATCLTALYAFGRLFARAPEPRFTHLEVAWSILLVVCAFSDARRLKLRRGVVTAAAAAAAILMFNLAGFYATVLDHRSDLLSRNEADRQAFAQIRSALELHPRGRIILINELPARWSARFMLEMAGAHSRTLEILPTISESPDSQDFAHDYSSCPVESVIERSAQGHLVRLSHPREGCYAGVFGRDLNCTLDRFRRGRLPSNAQWAECILAGACRTTPIIHQVRAAPEEELLFIAWRSRLEPPKIVYVGTSLR